jgi:hypothetical protein
MTGDYTMYKHQNFDSYYNALKKFVSLNSKINKRILKSIYESVNIFYKMSSRIEIDIHDMSNETLINQKVEYIISNVKNNNIESNISVCNDINNEILYITHFNNSNNKYIKIMLYTNKKKVYLSRQKKEKLIDFTIESILSND